MGFPAELKLKKHETFSIRDGWLEKGIINVKKNGNCLSKENGTRTLGLGTNMVKSLRYWLKACGIVEYKKETILTEFGKNLFRYDCYLDSLFSIWMIHVNLVSNYNEAPVFNRFFNNPYNHYEKGYLVSYIKDEFEKEGLPIKSLSSLDSDVNIVLKSYYSDDESSPENNMKCPLSRLELLASTNKKEYVKKSPIYNRLDCRVIYYAIIKYFACNEVNIGNELSFNIEDMIAHEDNPMNILNLSRSTFFMYLDELKRREFIELSKTAGLNTIYIKKIMTISELFNSYFGEVSDVR